MTFAELRPVLHTGTLVEIGGQGVPDDNNPNVFSDNIERLPEELLSIIKGYEVVAIDTSGVDAYTVRIELAVLHLMELPEHVQHLLDE